MFDKNYLGHNFIKEYNEKYDDYLCCKCKVEVWFNEKLEYIILDDYLKYGKINLLTLTCNENIIKNILE